MHFSSLASYDDSGVTGHKNCLVLEEGEYRFYIGTDVRNAELKLSIELPEKETVVIKQLSQCLAPVLPFKRMKPVMEGKGTYSVSFEDVPLMETDENQRRLDNMPQEIPYTGDCGI